MTYARLLYPRRRNRATAITIAIATRVTGTESTPDGHRTAMIPTMGDHRPQRRRLFFRLAER
jgi:hypothetical protein